MKSAFAILGLITFAFPQAVNVPFQKEGLWSSHRPSVHSGKPKMPASEGGRYKGYLEKGQRATSRTEDGHLALRP
jgi:hypothetical protein